MWVFCISFSATKEPSMASVLSLSARLYRVSLSMPTAMQRLFMLWAISMMFLRVSSGVEAKLSLM